MKYAKFQSFAKPTYKKSADFEALLRGLKI